MKNRQRAREKKRYTPFLYTFHTVPFLIFSSFPSRIVRFIARTRRDHIAWRPETRSTTHLAAKTPLFLAYSSLV